jgi:hypothetical protein
MMEEDFTVPGLGYVPARIKGALDRWVYEGIPPGGFTTAVLQNNLMEAVGRADEECGLNLRAIVAYVYNEVPAWAWGSRENMNEWAAKFGREGVERI